MSDSVNQLCTRCGLCCDGSLFADVELAGRKEASALEVMGLVIDDSGDETSRPLLLQPCAALKGKRCTIYPYRPGCCRTFECRLLQEVNRGVRSVEQAEKRIGEALNRIAQINRLLAHFGPPDQNLSLKERCEEALAMTNEADITADPFMRDNGDELEESMFSLEELIQETFLRDGSQ